MESGTLTIGQSQRISSNVNAVTIYPIGVKTFCNAIAAKLQIPRTRNYTKRIQSERCSIRFQNSVVHNECCGSEFGAHLDCRDRTYSFSEDPFCFFRESRFMMQGRNIDVTFTKKNIESLLGENRSSPWISER